MPDERKFNSMFDREQTETGTRDMAWNNKGRMKENQEWKISCGGV